jgi:sortase (surface protein transpeptidase)
MEPVGKRPVALQRGGSAIVRRAGVVDVAEVTVRDLVVPDVTMPDLGVVVDDREPEEKGGGRRRSQVLAVAGVVVVVGAGVTMFTIGMQGSGPPQPPASATVNPPPVVKARPMNRALPVRITIPRIRVDAPVEALGQNADGTVEVPTLTRPNLAGWYKYGPTPGQKGAAVVLGHVDAHRHQAVFFRLGSLQRGDHIHILRAGGSDADFVVDSVVSVEKDKFPTQSVYGKTKYPALRVVTCGGRYDKKSMHYLSNVIVYAHLVH